MANGENVPTLTEQILEKQRLINEQYNLPEEERNLDPLIHDLTGLATVAKDIPEGSGRVEKAISPLEGIQAIPKGFLKLASEIGAAYALGKITQNQINKIARDRNVPVETFNRWIRIGIPAAMEGVGAGAGVAGVDLLAGDPVNWQEARTASLFGAGGRLAGDAITGIRYPQKPLLTQTDELPARALEIVSRRGASISPGQVTTVGEEARFLPRSLDILENVVESSILGGGRVGAVNRKAGAIFTDILNNIIKGISRGGEGRGELGELILKGIEGSRQAWNTAADSAYKSLDDLIANKVKSGQIKSTLSAGTQGAVDTLYLPANKLLDKAKTIQTRAGRGVTDNPSLSKLLNNTINRLIDEKGNIQNLSFSELRIIRSELLKTARASIDQNPNAIVKAAKQMAGVVDDIMEQELKKHPGQVYETWRAANKLYKDGADVFYNKLINKIANIQPDQVTATFIKPNRPGKLRRLKESIDISTLKGRATWEKVQGQFLGDMLIKATDEATGVLSGAKLRNAIAKYGDEVLDELLTNKVARQNFDEIIDALILTQGQSGIGGAMKMLIPFTQASAVVNLLFRPSGASAGMLAAVTLGPDFLGKALTHPWLSRALVTGLKEKPGSRAAMTAWTRISSLMLHSAVAGEHTQQPGWKELSPEEIDERRQILMP